jgi:hypothetical protein
MTTTGQFLLLEPPLLTGPSDSRSCLFSKSLDIVHGFFDVDDDDDDAMIVGCRFSDLHRCRDAVAGGSARIGAFCWRTDRNFLRSRISILD